MIASAYLNKVSSWPTIQSEDGKALHAYSLFLHGCCNAMDEVHSLCELDTPANMIAVIKRLPYKLRDKWQTVSCDIQERYHRRAIFVDIVTFMERQVKILMDPVFGNLQEAPALVAIKEGSRIKSPRLRAVVYQGPNQTNQDSIQALLKHEEPNFTRQQQKVINQTPSPSEYTPTRLRGQRLKFLGSQRL